MADVRPLRGLRYQPVAAGDLGDVIAPPYDVISEEAQRGLYERSPYNIVRVEFGIDEPAGADRYHAAAETLAAWRRSGVLVADARPAFYLYEQRFERGGRSYRRRSIISRVRLEPWERGVILPHEHTLSGPKEDRLQLLRACRTNVSPVFGLYRPDGGAAIAACEPSTTHAEPVVDAQDGTGQRHLLWLVDDPTAVAALTAQFAGRTLYIADGHHRYETALAYRDERRAAASAWTGEEPENFVLMALTAADDPGLLILPIHRLVSPESRPPSAIEDASAAFDARPIAAGADRLTALAELQHSMQAAAAQSPIGCLRPDPTFLLLTLRDAAGVQARMPVGHSAAWRALGVNVLQYGILESCYGIDLETVRSGRQVGFTESAEEALSEVANGRAALAFLLNATRPEEIFAIADEGDRMPQKSTYFYPKLGTGLVFYAMDAAVPSAPAAG